MFRAILTSVEDNNVDTLFAAGGALFGLSADLINRSAGRELVNKVLNDLSSPTKSAVIPRFRKARESLLTHEWRRSAERCSTIYPLSCSEDRGQA
jgi:hypothetical protein